VPVPRRTDPRAPRRWLVETAERERRLVLTSERAFAAARHTDACLLVAAPDKKAQLVEVLAALRIDVTEGRLLSRCAACNGEFAARRAPPPRAAHAARHACHPPQSVRCERALLWPRGCRLLCAWPPPRGAVPGAPRCPWVHGEQVG